MHQPAYPNDYDKYKAAGGVPAPLTGKPYDFLKASEGLRLQAYDDATGKPLAVGEKPKGVATIGYGATKINGKPVQPGDKITQEQADKLFASQVVTYQNWKNLAKGNLTPSQEEALTSFEYNLGSGIWQKNAMPIIAAINAGDFKKAGQIMQQYTYAGGVHVPGLATRRAKEAQLLLA